MSCDASGTFFGDCSCDQGGGGFVLPPGGNPSWIYFGSYFDGGSLVYVNTTADSPGFCSFVAPANAFYRIVPGSDFTGTVFFNQRNGAGELGAFFAAGHRYRIPASTGGFFYLFINAAAVGH
jgi:hypothetical protein